MRVDQVEAGARAPMPEQPRLHVGGHERSPQQRVVEQIDLPDGEIVRGAPIRIESRELGRLERRMVDCSQSVLRCSGHLVSAGSRRSITRAVPIGATTVRFADRRIFQRRISSAPHTMNGNATQQRERGRRRRSSCRRRCAGPGTYGDGGGEHDLERDAPQQQRVGGHADLRAATRGRCAPRRRCRSGTRRCRGTSSSSPGGRRGAAACRRRRRRPSANRRR